MGRVCQPSSQHISKLKRIACSRQCYDFTFIDVKEQWIYLSLFRSHSIFIQSWKLKTPDGKKQLHIIGVEQQTNVVENHRYICWQTQWSEMTPLSHKHRAGSIPTDISSSKSWCDGVLDQKSLPKVRNPKVKLNNKAESSWHIFTAIQLIYLN
jgi:hypothetical protein